MRLRLWLVPVVLVLAATSLTATSDAVSQFVVTGTVRMAGTPDAGASIFVEQRLPAGARGAVFDDADGFWYGDVGPVVTPNTSGVYTVDLAPGAYRLTALDATLGGDLREAETVVTGAGTADLDLGVPPDCGLVPAVQGFGRVGDVMSAFPGTFVPTESVGTVTYQWYRRDPGDPDAATAYTRIEGQRGPTYAVTAADLGRRLQVSVSAVGPFGEITCDSTDSNLLLPAPIHYPGTNPAHLGAGQTRPTGIAKVGQRLHAPALQGLPATTTVTYQWYRRHPGASPIHGATGPTYRLHKADRGVRVYVIAQLSDPAYLFRTIRSDTVRVR